MKTYTLSRHRESITCRDNVPEETAWKWLEGHALWFDSEGGARDPWGGRANLARVPIAKSTLIAKREARSASRSFLYALAGRSSRSKEAFEIGLHLRERGVSAALPLAFIETSKSGVVQESCLILEVADGVPLRELLLSRLGSIREETKRDGFKKRLWTAIAAEVARLHAACVRQRDLKAPNLLAKEEDDGRFTVTLVDLEGMTKLAGLPPLRVRTRDLARLLVSFREEGVKKAGVSPEDWGFLVTRYLEESNGMEPSPKQVSSFVQATLEWAIRKEERNRSRERIIR